MCSFLVCDIASFNDASRVDPVRVRVRKAMYDGLDRSLAGAGLRLDECYHEDRGDGVMVVLPPDVRTELLLTAVLDRLRAEVRHHNAAANEATRMRLRVAVNTGEAESDGRGIVSTALTHAFRLLDAAPLKEAVAAAETGIALIVSRRVYDDVVSQGRGLVDPGDYYQVKVKVKETSDDAWVMVPGAARPSGGQGARGAHGAGARGRRVRGVPADVPVADLFRVVDGLLEIPACAPSAAVTRWSRRCRWRSPGPSRGRRRRAPTCSRSSGHASTIRAVCSSSCRPSKGSWASRWRCSG